MVHKSYQMGVCVLAYVYLGILQMKKSLWTVGVYPFMAQIFDLSPLRLSLQLQQLPPQKRSFLVPLLI